MGEPALAGGDEARYALGVACSLGGRRWVWRQGDARHGLALAQRLGVPEIVGRIMAGRGVGLDAATDFLEPKLRALLPDPSALRDMDKAAARLVAAVERGEPIAIFGDYDVDGATASALLARFLASVGCPARVYIPDRLSEGYGPNAPALLRLQAEGARLVVTVDCGVTAHAPLAVAAEAGLNVIVLDHHLAEPLLPPAVAVVDPNRLDEDGRHGQLAAVGVAFLLAIAANRLLRQTGRFRTRSEPDLLALLDLVALGTVCDMVPLTGVNRALVAQGLKVMARRGNVGLAALAQVAGIDGEITPYHLGFQLGPRVNAGGRVGESSLGARLLMTADPGEAGEIARRLDAHNVERRRLEQEALEEALAGITAGADAAPVVVAAGDGWHPGVIGIVAGRLAERFHRPALVIAFDGEEGRGSARSVEGVDIGAAIIAARQSGLLANGGGHPMAAGFALARSRLPAFAAFLADRIGPEMRRDDVAPTYAFDGALVTRGADVALAQALARLMPYGVGNPEPRFVLPAQRVMRAETVGDGHVRCLLADAGGGRLPAIAFRRAGEPVGQALLAMGGRPLHIAGRLRADRYQGRDRVQLQIDDAAWP